MAKMDRRDFLTVSGGAGLGFTALSGFFLRPGTRHFAKLTAQLGEGGYGPLVAAGDELALPKGFQYRRIGIAGSRMSDGNRTPAAHDGMGTFELPNGNIRLIRNHEVGRRPEDRPVVEPAYDRVTGGGTTSLEIDPVTREVVRDFVSLSGTAVNCAGGPTPWGTWLSCEETTAGTAAGIDRDHGYVFEVPAEATGPVDPRPLKAMGRFEHEAVAVDPATGTIYETEDRIRGGFYRFLPTRPYVAGTDGDLSAGGRLQILAVKGQPNYDCSTGQEVGTPLPVAWVDITDADPESAGRNASAVFRQGWRHGAARMNRGEGCWYGNGSVYFSCTIGGDAGEGQIWRYTPGGDEEDVLTLVFESPSSELLNRPDNICVSPRGGIVICEDGSFSQYVRGLTAEGRIFDFARNIVNDSEFAGANFSPDGQTLFVNLQWEPGATFAIWGPWEQGAL